MSAPMSGRRLTDEQTRKTALVFARGRSLLGLGLTLLPGPATKLGVGKSSAPASALMRMVGVRDLAIGLGALPASLIFGAIWDRSGSPTAFLFGATLALFAAIGMTFVAPGRPLVPVRQEQ